MQRMRAPWSCLLVACITLACACASSNPGDEAHPGAQHGSGGSTSHADAAVDASLDPDAATQSGGGGHTHGGGDAHTSDGGKSSGAAGSDASSGGRAGASGRGGGGAKRDSGSGAIDSAGADAGGDSGAPDSGTDSCASGVICNGMCCAAAQVCKATQPFALDVDWDFTVGATALHTVVGSTLRFNFDDTRHDVQLFATEAAFTNCDFNDAELLSTRSPYTWNASSAGDFYFGCSTVSSRGSHCKDDNMKLHVVISEPVQACAAP